MTPAPQQIRDSSFSGALFLWVFGILSIETSWLMFVGIGPDDAKNSVKILFVATFAAIGVLLLPVAIYFSLRAAKYGRSVFDSPMLPTVTGGVLVGTIRLPKPLMYLEPIHLRLACILRVSGSNSPSEILWQDRSTLDRFSPDARVSEIPVYFRMPSDGQPTSSGISWRLDAKTKARDGHYSATFLIPVMSKRAGDAEPVLWEMQEIADATAALRSPDLPRRQPVDCHIHFSPLSGRGSRVELLPGRNFVLALAGIVFGLIFIGVGATIQFLGFTVSNRHIQIDNDIPIIAFCIAFCGMGATSFLVGLRLLFLKTTITVRDGIILIENSAGLGGHRREIYAADIVDITATIQGQSLNRIFYSINALRNKGSPVKICGTIYDKSDADWLAAEFKSELLMR